MLAIIPYIPLIFVLVAVVGGIIYWANHSKKFNTFAKKMTTSDDFPIDEQTSKELISQEKQAHQDIVDKKKANEKIVKEIGKDTNNIDKHLSN